MHLPQSILSAPLASLTFFFTSKLKGKLCLQRMDFLSLALIKKEWKKKLWLVFILIKVKEKAWVHHRTSLVGFQRPPGGHMGQRDSEHGFLTEAGFLGLEAEVLEYNIATCLPQANIQQDKSRQDKSHQDEPQWDAPHRIATHQDTPPSGSPPSGCTPPG